MEKKRYYEKTSYIVFEVMAIIAIIVSLILNDLGHMSTEIFRIIVGLLLLVFAGTWIYMIHCAIKDKKVRNKNQGGEPKAKPKFLTLKSAVMKKLISFLTSPNGRLLLVATLVSILLIVFWDQFDDRKWVLVILLCVLLPVGDYIFAFQLYEPGRWSSIVWTYRLIYSLLTLSITVAFAAIIIRGKLESNSDYALQLVFTGSMMFVLLWRWFAFAWNRKRIYAKPT